jgi:hypothetical protein
MNKTIKVDMDGNVTIPCRCGVDHAGPYAEYDYAHHNCFHAEALVWDLDTGTVMCPLCGQTFSVEEPAPIGRIGARRILRAYGFRFDWRHFWRGQWVKP